MREPSTGWPTPVGGEREVGSAAPLLLALPVLALCALAALAYLLDSLASPFLGGLQ